jgi:hypothetical protein
LSTDSRTTNASATVPDDIPLEPFGSDRVNDIDQPRMRGVHRTGRNEKFSGCGSVGRNVIRPPPGALRRGGGREPCAQRRLGEINCFQANFRAFDLALDYIQRLIIRVIEQRLVALFLESLEVSFDFAPVAGERRERGAERARFDRMSIELFQNRLQHRVSLQLPQL